MDPVELLRLLVFHEYWFAIAENAFLQYPRLTSTQQSQIAQRVIVLKEALTQSGLDKVDDTLVTLAALTPEMSHRKGNLLDQTFDFQPTVSPSVLAQMVSWVKRGQLITEECRALLAESPSTAIPFVHRVLLLFANFWFGYPLLLKQQRALIYRQLNTQQGQQLARYAVEQLDRPYPDPAETLLHESACCVPGALEGLHFRILQRGITLPTELFQGADTQTRDALLERLPSDPEPYLTLGILASIGDPVVKEQLLRFQVTQPAWVSRLYFDVLSHTLGAGWQLNADGTIRYLTYDACFQLVSKKNILHRFPLSTPIHVLSELTSEHCRWCGRAMVTLFDFDLLDARLKFLGLTGKRLRIITCLDCIMMTNATPTVFVNVDFNGNTSWHDSNGLFAKARPLEEDLIDDIDYEEIRDIFALDVEPRPVLESYMLNAGVSQIGGHPKWLMDIENPYPQCPNCNQLMPFIGQVQLSDFGYEEGIIYAFLCASCHVAATHCQG